MFSHTYITFFQLPFFQLHSFIAFFHYILSKPGTIMGSIALIWSAT